MGIPKAGDLEAGQVYHECKMRPTKPMKNGNLLRKQPEQSLQPSDQN